MFGPEMGFEPGHSKPMVLISGGPFMRAVPPDHPDGLRFERAATRRA